MVQDVGRVLGRAKAQPDAPRERSRFSSFLRFMAGRPIALIATIILVVTVLMALAPHWFTSADPLRTNFRNAFAPPSWEHPLGTDDLGRDTFARLVYGTRPSLTVALGSVVLAMVVGVPMGIVAGYARGWIDTVMMRMWDALLSFPPLILALAITAALGPGVRNLAIAISVVYIPRFARTTRGAALVVREMLYVETVRAAGAGTGRVLFCHILPNVMPHVIVQFSFTVAFALLYEAGLSFLGLGVQPPEPSWGFMLRSSFRFVHMSPWGTYFSGMSIFILVLALNMFGDALRDLLDPRREQKI